jgi:hypothetical protein
MPTKFERAAHGRCRVMTHWVEHGWIFTTDPRDAELTLLVFSPPLVFLPPLFSHPFLHHHFFLGGIGYVVLVIFISALIFTSK